ncbi:cob(I)yrinic acid a,c-diamide adenosyltransferase [Peptococcaceae bacterium 1198_IL3148]
MKKLSNDTTGLVLVFTGEGKGKTTAALGTALRAWGQGMKVLFLQFIKGSWHTGEQKAFAKLGNNIEIHQLGLGFIDFNDENQMLQHRQAAQQGIKMAQAAIASGEYQMIVLDEINYAIAYRLVEATAVVELIKTKPQHLHIILTGREASAEIIDLADLVTKMEMIKHPYQKGITAQKGIEF